MWPPFCLTTSCKRTLAFVKTFRHKSSESARHNFIMWALSCATFSGLPVLQRRPENVFVIIKMCYVHNQWYDISCATLYVGGSNNVKHTINSNNNLNCRSQWPCGLRRRSTAACLLRSWVRIPPRAWMFVCCDCCVLSGRGLCEGLIIRSEEFYRLWRVVVCDQETS